MRILAAILASFSIFTAGISASPVFPVTKNRYFNKKLCSKVLERKLYTLCYDYNLRAPRWLYYHIDPLQVGKDKYNTFFGLPSGASDWDPDIEEKYQNSWAPPYMYEGLFRPTRTAVGATEEEKKSLR